MLDQQGNELIIEKGWEREYVLVLFVEREEGIYIHVYVHINMGRDFLPSFLAGGCAGVCEISITFPLEFLKVNTQIFILNFKTYQISGNLTL